jgi:hypothetical protein
MRVILPRLNELIKIFFNKRKLDEFKFDYLFVNFFISLIQEGLLNFVSLDDIFSIIKFSKIDSKNIYFFLFLNIIQ